MSKRQLILPALVSLAVLISIGCDNTCDDSAIAAEVTWDVPVPAGCYTMPAEGFLVRVIVDGNPVKTDTVYTNSWQGYLPAGSTLVKVAGFYTSGVDLVVGRQMTPSCELLPDTLWSPKSDPILVRPQVGPVSKPVISVIMR